jgi:signal transduction histidine kinase
MELVKPKKIFYYIISSLVLMVLLLGSWWLYLVFKLANKLQDLNHDLLNGNLLSMIKWEGVTFILLLLALTITLVYVYIQDHKKSSAIHAFFASLTHELKTPLASMKLQSEVLAEHIQELNTIDEQEKLLKYTQRIKNDALRLEYQLDNHLQLSRVERSAPLNLTNINFDKFLDGQAQRYGSLVQIIKKVDSNIAVKADDFALQVIIQNFIENAINHCVDKSPKLYVTQDPSNKTSFLFTSNGAYFDGELSKLGILFYKHNSPKGSGIGLYLIKNLMRQMNGKLLIANNESLVFTITFSNSNEIS